MPEGTIDGGDEDGGMPEEQEEGMGAPPPACATPADVLRPRTESLS